MAIARAKRTQPKPKPRRQPKPDRPEHVLPAPYARLFRLGEADYPEVYDSIANELKQKDTDVAARQLLRMIEDTSYYDYSDEDDDSESGDPRSWTRMHALCTFQRLGDAALIGLEPLLSLLDDDDDYINEAAPFYYAAMGEPAIELLGTAVRDTEQDTYYRAGAGTALAEMGEAHPELRDRIVSILEQAVAVEQEDKTSVALLITNLLDLDAKESLGIIQQAFAENRVDLTVIQMPDVEEHFEMPVTSDYVDWTKLPEYSDGEDDEFSEPQDWSDEEALFAPEPEEPREVQTPYVAAEKVGRNEPCPCGSGKKYKKCCGA